jgi:hypothetical protein
MFLDRTATEQIFNFHTRIGWNSRSPEYRFGRQLSQISDGLINDSKRLVICELRQSETRSIAKTIFLADHTYLYKTGFWQKISTTSPETSHTKNVTNELSFLVVTHTTHFDIRFDCYGILKSYFSSRHVMDRLDCSCSVRFLGHKMGETCQGLNTTSKRNCVSFPTPRQTPVSDNRTNGYGHLSTTTCRVHRLLKFFRGRSWGLASSPDSETYFL